jgi:putative Mg2+ transporter-C (MgtC) family protein
MAVNGMELTLSWSAIGIRLLLATLFSLVIGLNRDEKGHPAGMRTTMLVCLAATLAQLQANLLLATAGKTTSSFGVLDLERLPLGILSGIGFIGAGVILKRENDRVSGVTTAATIWFVTVLGLLFGGGQLRLGIIASLLAIAILWGLRRVENVLHRRHTSILKITFSSVPNENDLRSHLKSSGCSIKQWTPTYGPQGEMITLQCMLAWKDRSDREPHTPISILTLARTAYVTSLTWSE